MFVANLQLFLKFQKIEEQFLHAVNITPTYLILPTDYLPAFTRSLADWYPEEVVSDIIYHSIYLIPVFYSRRFN